MSKPSTSERLDRVEAALDALRKSLEKQADAVRPQYGLGGVAAALDGIVKALDKVLSDE